MSEDQHQSKKQRTAVKYGAAFLAGILVMAAVVLIAWSLGYIHFPYAMAASPTTAITKEELCDVIDAINTDHYFIQIPRGNLTTFFNHITHGAIALYKLGASREQVDAYIKWYSKGLHKPEKDSKTIPARSMQSDETDVWKLLGQRAGYYNLLEYYKGSLVKHGGSLDELLNEEFPKLMKGMAGGALHGIIHAGYGFSENRPQLVCEGLAFLHFAHFPIKFTGSSPTVQRLGHEGAMDILQVLGEIRNNNELRDFWRRRSREELELHYKSKPYPPSQFQVKMNPLLDDKADLLADYVNKIKIPQFQYNPDKDAEKQISHLLKWVLDSIITLFLAVEKSNDFFLLHGVTGSWAVSQILGAVKDYDTSVQGVRILLSILLGVYIEEDCPSIDENLLVDVDVSNLTWGDIQSRVYQLPADTDEHVYKLVHVCHHMGQINKDPNMDNIYKRAAIVSMTHPLSFPDPIEIEQ